MSNKAHPFDEHSRDEALIIAGEFLKQARRCAEVGLTEQSEVLLQQVMLIAEGLDDEMLSLAAWEIAWLLVGRGAYAEAAKRFRYVAALPVRSPHLWRAERQVLEQLCMAAAGEPLAAQHKTGLPRPAARLQVAYGANRVAEQPASSTEHTEPPLVEIRSLGLFQVLRAGEVLPPCRSRKSLTALRYLLTRRGQAAPREELMCLLWPDVPTEVAAHNLHVAVNLLRRYLDAPYGTTYLLFEAGHYALNGSGIIKSDYTDFQQLSDEGDRYWHMGDLEAAKTAYINAVTRYSGDYYLDDQDSDWALIERERLLTKYLSALERLGRIYFDQGVLERAIDCYGRLTQRDPYREDAHLQLMHCYYRLGRRSDALRQYERCANLLMTDLGLRPVEEMQALYDAIGQATLAPGTTTSTTSTPRR